MPALIYRMRKLSMLIVRTIVASFRASKLKTANIQVISMAKNKPERWVSNNPISPDGWAPYRVSIIFGLKMGKDGMK